MLVACHLDESCLSSIDELHLGGCHSISTGNANDYDSQSESETAAITCRRSFQIEATFCGPKISHIELFRSLL
jgi:hypothetical protein